MATKAYGRMVFWEGACLWVLGKRPGDRPYPKTSFHSHHAVQVTLALEGSFTLEGRETHARAVVAAAVAPDVEHMFEAHGDAVAHLFVDPDGHAGRELHRALLSTGEVALITSPHLGKLREQLHAALRARGRTDAPFIELGRSLLAQLAPGSERDERPEVRVRRMSAWAAARLETPVSLEDVAAHVGLSPGRARHLFVDQTGLPFRTYLLWLRLMRAVELFSAGSSLTSAAHGAGFSDSSHFSRTFRRMFGIAADSLRVS
ncbi:MAG: AraC family transcriptional regulator [Kofleriaceae bacterium]